MFVLNTYLKDKRIKETTKTQEMNKESNRYFNFIQFPISERNDPRLKNKLVVKLNSNLIGDSL